MMTFEETIYEVQGSLEELLKHFGDGDMKNMPDDLPPVAKVIWIKATAILAAMETEEFEEITN